MADDRSRSAFPLAAERYRRTFAPVDHTAFPWTDERWQAPPLPSATIYELHVGTFTPAGTFGAIERLDYLVELGITHVEADAGGRVFRQSRLGLRRRRLYAPHQPMADLKASNGWSMPATARLGRVLDVVYNHLGPAGNYLARFGPYFTDRYAHAMGARGKSSTAPIATSAPFLRQRVDVAARLSLRRSAAGRRARDRRHSATHILEELARGGRLEATRPASGADRGKRSQRSPRRAIPRDRRLRHHAQWSDDLHHACTRYSPASTAAITLISAHSHLGKALEESLCTTVATPRIGSVRRQAGCGAAGTSASRDISKITIKSATAQGERIRH